MKKTLLILIFLSVLFSCFAIGFPKKTETHEFDSEPMLEKFYVEPENSSSRWNDVKISLITVSGGDALYSWFGHSGILIEDPRGLDTFYDYGRFAFSSAFYINFIKGVLWYRCGGFYADSEIERFIEEKRTISKLELDLAPEKKEAIASFLKTNSSEPYNRYLYHHFNDNCATRLRDILNYATDGDFKDWAEKQPGYSYRAQTSRILHRNMLIEWILDLVQGPSVDAKATAWNEMFLPENLEKYLMEYGKLTKERTYLSDFRETDTRPVSSKEPLLYIAQSMYTGFVLAALLLLLRRFFPKAFAVENIIINTFLAVVGSILFYMMFFSGHSFSWNNENILFVNPLLFIPLFSGFRKKNNCIVSASIYGSEVLIITAMIIIKLVAPGVLEQENFPQLLSVLPVYTALTAICLSKINKLD